MRRSRWMPTTIAAVFVLGMLPATVPVMPEPQPTLVPVHHKPHAPVTDFLATRDGGLLNEFPDVSYLATWYDGRDDGLNGGKWTSTGTHPAAGRTVAVDPRVVPYGSWIEVVIGHQVEFLRAEDTGGSIVGNRIDIYDPDRTACIDNGVQGVMVRVLLRE